MDLYFSKYNIITKIKNSDSYLILNSLSGNADIIPPSEYANISGKNYTDEYIQKGYVTTYADEQSLFRNAYIDFLEKRDNSEIQIFFVTNYTCNFTCSYCYQDQYEQNKITLNKTIINAFYRYIDTNFNNKQKYITLFGGEPLLPGKHHKELINVIIQEATNRSIDIAIVSNGYHLNDYLDILLKGNIREVQVTLDGTEEVHNKRRIHKTKKNTFREIVSGIDNALQNNIPINLRSVIDKENIENFQELAHFAVNKGWTGNPIFKTQIGRNYELHHCQTNSRHLFDRAGLYEELYHLIKSDPKILLYHEPAFSISKFLLHNGSLPEPLFDSCPGCKTEWAFDFTGNIYPCTATVGKKGEEIGTYYPDTRLSTEKFEEWEERDVTTIPECKNCNLQHLCGGGCGSVAKNKTGNLLSPDCRPVDKLLELGISLYFEKETKE